MTTFSYEETKHQYNPYTKQIEEVGISKADLDGVTARVTINEADIVTEVTSRENGDITLQSAITLNEGNINLKVSSDDVINSINVSTEGINIAADNITIDGTTTFSANYDPTDKINTGNAAADINANVTTISGGKITAGSITATNIAAATITGNKIVANTLTATQIDVDNLFAQTITASGTISGAILEGSTIKTGTTGNDRVELTGGGVKIYDSSNRLRINIPATGVGAITLKGVVTSGGSTYSLDNEIKASMLEQSSTLRMDGGLLLGINSAGAQNNLGLTIAKSSQINFLNDIYDETGISQVKSSLYINSSGDLKFTDQNGVQTILVTST